MRKKISDKVFKPLKETIPDAQNAFFHNVLKTLKKPALSYNDYFMVL